MSAPSQQIELRAYQYWEERGCPIGTPDEDWFKAQNSFPANHADQEPGGLSRLGREVGTAVGSVVAFLAEIDSVTNHPS